MDYRFERPPDLPVPLPAEEADGYFVALKSQRLDIQYCADCDALLHPPRSRCPTCQRTALQWRTMLGKGTVYSYVVTHQAIHPALVGYTPLATVQVQLEEGPIVVSNLLDVAPDAIEIGTPVVVVFERVDADVVLPLFRRAVED